MSPEWNGHGAELRGVMFYRQIVRINAARRRLVVDTPIRHQLKRRDAARVYPTGPRPRKWCTGAISAPSRDHYAARLDFASFVVGAGSGSGGGFRSVSSVM